MQRSVHRRQPAFAVGAAKCMADVSPATKKPCSRARCSIFCELLARACDEGAGVPKGSGCWRPRPSGDARGDRRVVSPGPAAYFRVTKP